MGDYKDDLFGPAPERPYRAADTTSWGGFAGRPGDASNPAGQGNGAVQDSNRYRGLGQAAAQRQAYQNDWSRANGYALQAQDARGSQMDALSLQQQAANGQAPSAAQSLSRNMLDQSLQAQMAGAASARGGSLAQAAAMRGASQQAGAMQQQGMNQIGALRAQEMAQARDAYSHGAGAVRGQDFAAQGLAQQQQGMDMQSELAQRQMNQQAQMGYEQMGWNTQNADLNASLTRYGIDTGSNNQAADRDFQKDEKWTDRMWGLAGGVISGLGGILSDEEAKVPVDMRAAMTGGPVSATDWAQGGGGGGMLAGGAPGGGLRRGLGSIVGGVGRGMMSDERSKVPTGVMGYEEGARIGPDGMGYIEKAEPPSIVPSKFVAMQRDNEREGARAGEGGSLAKAAMANVKRQAPAMDLDKWADAELAKYRNENARFDRGEYRGALAGAAEQSRGMADAAKAMASVPYAYKPGLQPPEQTPGEVNVGPIAQNMAANPVTATAVKRDPATGMLMVDQGKMTKVLGGVVANQQTEIDKLKAGLAATLAKRGK